MRALAPATLALLLASALLAAETPRDAMSETDIRAVIVGATFDGRYPHGLAFTEEYRADGSLAYSETARTFTGRWSVTGEIFCTLYDQTPGGCWRVRRRGANCFEFHLTPVPAPGEALSEMLPQNWGALGWRRDRPSTCPSTPTAEGDDLYRVNIPMTIQAYAWWSIYVRTSSMRKLKDVHLPPITTALEQLDFEWKCAVDDDLPGLFRVVTHQNLKGDTVPDIVIPVLKRACKLATTWSISGLEDLSASAIIHVMGTWNSTKPRNQPPALESMMFEISPGAIVGRSPDGNAWEVADGPGQTRGP